MKHIIRLFLLVTLTLGVKADTVTYMKQMVTGRNVYAPCVIHDPQDGKYKMWYGGWQNSNNVPKDDIWYRESTDGTNWTTSPIKVIDHATLGMYHVNDPTVIKAWNAVLHTNMYWIYFTAIACDPNTCDITNHHIWAASGFDGKNWGAYTKVIDGYNGAGVFAPSVVSIDPTNGEFWLYYQITGVADRIILTKLQGGTTVTTTEEVFVSPQDGAHNPDVSILPDGTWSMCYNRINTNNVFNIWRLTSTNGTYWTNDHEVLDSGCTPFCVAQTPNQRWVDTNHYWLYYGLDESITNPSAEIHGWYMQATP